MSEVVDIDLIISKLLEGGCISVKVERKKKMCDIFSIEEKKKKKMNDKETSNRLEINFFVSIVVHIEYCEEKTKKIFLNKNFLSVNLFYVRISIFFSFFFFFGVQKLKRVHLLLSLSNAMFFIFSSCSFFFLLSLLSNATILHFMWCVPQ